MLSAQRASQSLRSVTKGEVVCESVGDKTLNPNTNVRLRTRVISNYLDSENVKLIVIDRPRVGGFGQEEPCSVP